MRGSSREERAHETKPLRLRAERRRGSEELFVHDSIVHVQKQLCSPRDGRRTPRLLKEAVAPATPPMWTCSSLRERSRKGTEPLDGKRRGTASTRIPAHPVAGRIRRPVRWPAWRGGQRVGRGPSTEATVWEWVRSGGAPSPADKTLTPISSYVDAFLRLDNAERLPHSSEGRLGSEGSHLATFSSPAAPLCRLAAVESGGTKVRLAA